MADKKYLDNAGLDRVWDKIKAFLGSNYSTKSELTDGLAGKANSSHTHTVNQITDLKTNSIKPLNTAAGPTNILPSINVGEMKIFHSDRGINIILPSGGKFMVLFIAQPGINGMNKAGIYSGGSRISSPYSDEGYVSAFYIRLS